MRNLKKWLLTGLVSFLIVIGSGAFYWFQWRPSAVRSTCNRISEEAAVAKYAEEHPGYLINGKTIGKPDPGTFARTDYDGFYKSCMRQHGMEP